MVDTCLVTGVMVDAKGVALPNQSIFIKPSGIMTASGGAVLPADTVVITGSDGAFSGSFVPGIYRLTWWHTQREYSCGFLVPDDPSASLSDCISGAGGIPVVPAPGPIGPVGPPGPAALSPEGAGYSTRPAFVAAVSAGDLDGAANGNVVVAGGLSYSRKIISTAIPDLPGWVPNGDIYADHFGTNSTPGTTDTSLYIQAAINYASSVGGAVVNLGPNGVRATYNTTASISINSSRVQIHFNGCELNLNDSTGLLSNLKVGDGVSRRNSVVISGPGAITRTQAATAGYAIEADLTGLLVIDGRLNIFGDNKIWGGVKLYRAIKNRLDIDIGRTLGHDIYLLGESGSTTTDTFFGSSYFDRSAGDSIVIGDYVSGVFFDQFPVVYNCAGDGLVFASTTAGGSTTSVVGKLNLDTVGGHAINALGRVTNVDLTGSWISGAGEDSIAIGQYVDDFKMDSAIIYVAPGKYAFDLQAGKNIQAVGTTCAGGAGAYKFGAGVSDVEVTGGTIRNTTGIPLAISAGAKRISVDGAMMHTVGPTLLSGSIAETESTIRVIHNGRQVLLTDVPFVGTNLNADSFTNSGVFYGQFANVDGASRNGWLEVFPSNTTDVCMQRFTHNNSDSVYLRRKVSGTWAAWKAFTL